MHSFLNSFIQQSMAFEVCAPQILKAFAFQGLQHEVCRMQGHGRVRGHSHLSVGRWIHGEMCLEGCNWKQKGIISRGSGATGSAQGGLGGFVSEPWGKIL